MLQCCLARYEVTRLILRTIGFEYNGKPRTSFNAFFAISALSNDTKACPRMRKFECATTSSTSPYDLNNPRRDAFRTGILIFSFRFWMYSVSVADSYGAGAGAAAPAVASAAISGGGTATGAGATMG